MRKLIVLGLFTLTTASADGIIYISTANDEFGSVDLLSGAFTPIATTPVQLVGLGYLGGTTLFGMDAVSNFYSIDTTTGALTTIGPTGVALVGFGNSTAGDIVGISSSSLYEIGSDGSAFESFPGTPTGGLAVFGFDAYWTETNGQLWGSRVGNPGPGLIGNTGQNDLDALVFEEVGLASSSTVLYAFASDGHIFTLNTGTGAAIDTGVTTISGITGAAFLNLPEPAAVFLVSAGLLIMAGLHRAITCQRRT